MSFNGTSGAAGVGASALGIGGGGSKIVEGGAEGGCGAYGSGVPGIRDLDSGKVRDGFGDRIWPRMGLMSIRMKTRWT